MEQISGQFSNTQGAFVAHSQRAAIGFIHSPLFTKYAPYLPLGLLLTVIFLLLMVLNIFTPTWGDDWYRALNPADAGEMFQRIMNEYQRWTGRSTVLFATFLSLLKYPGSLWVFAMLNSAIFCLLLVGVFRAAIGRWPTSNLADCFAIFSAFLLVWFQSHSFGEVVLWKTGAIAYLWVMTFSIFMVNPFFNLLVEHHTVPNTHIKLFILPIAAAVLAVSLENVAVAVGLAMLFSLLVHWFQNSRPPLWYWLTFIGHTIGSAVLLVAPGNYARFEQQDSGMPLYQRFNELVQVIWQHGTEQTDLFYLFILLALLIAVTRIKINLMRPWLWALFAMMLAFAMAGSTGVNFKNRTAFVAEVAFMVTLTAMIFPLWQRAKSQLQIVIPAFGVLLLIFTMDLLVVLEKYLATYQQSERRSELFQAYHRDNHQKIYLPSMVIPGEKKLEDDIVNGRYFLRDIHQNKVGNEWRNGTFARYYGFEFATRLNKPYLVYLPEFKTNKVWSIHQADEQILLASRQEQLGYARFTSLLLISPKNACISRATAYLDGHEQAVNSDADIGVINALGQLDYQFCAVRLQLPEHSAAVNLKTDQGKLIQVDLTSHLATEQFPKFMKLASKVWQACDLHYHQHTRVDHNQCLVSAKEGDKMIMTWGPYYDIKPGSYELAITYQTSSGDVGKWDAVLQFKDRMRGLLLKPLVNTQGRIQTDKARVEINHNGGKLEIRSHYHGRGQLSVHEISLAEIN